MTACEEARRAAAEAWGGAPLPARVRRHMESCAACSREAAATDRLLERIAGEPGRMDGEEPGEAYWATFNDRVRERLGAPAPARRPWRRTLLRPVALAAAVALLGAAAALTLWQRQAPGSVPEGSPRSGEPPAARQALQRAIQEDPAALERRMEEALRSAPDSVSLDDLALLPSGVDGELYSVPAGGDGEEDEDAILDSEEALARAGEMAALLAGRAGTGWPEIDGLVQGLTEDETRLMIEALDPGEAEPSPAGA